MALPKMREMIDALVAAPSVSATDPSIDSSNAPVIDLLAEWLEREGWSIELLPLPDTGAKKKINLIATRGRGEGGLVLSGHTDTVPFDEGKWKSDPFRATERDGRIYGLGVCDMKAFFAIAIEAARAFDEKDFTEPLILLATADEESGMDGARALANLQKPKARRALIGEPTGLVPARMHKGCAMERLELTGRSGHSSNPRYGVSALDAMHGAITELMALREELARDHQNPVLDPPCPTINFGRIEGGDNPNRICARCSLDYDVRVLPGMEMSEVRKGIHARIARALEKSGVEIAHIALTTSVPPFETREDAALVRAVESLTGAPAGGVAFGTEAPFLRGLGMDTVVLGPGDISVAHQPDEHLPLDRIEPMLHIVRGLVDRFCIRGDAK
jgi:acetylornithine deacetylase